MKYVLKVCVEQYAMGRPSPIQFLLAVARMTTCVCVCVYAGSFHLLHLMFDDYVLYLVESLQSHERYNELLASVRGARHNNNNNSGYCTITLS